AMKLLFPGLVLCFIGLVLNRMDLIFFTVGAALCACGSFKLRLENSYFKACFGISSVMVVLGLVKQLLSCLAGTMEFFRVKLINIIIPAEAVAFLCLLAAFYIGLKQVEKKAGASICSGNALMLAIWYLLLLAVSFISGMSFAEKLRIHLFIFLVIMAALLALFIRSLVKLFRELEEPGYSINAAASKVPDITAVLGLVAISVALLIGSFAASRVSMKWSEITIVSGSEEQSLSAELSSQGVSAEMLALLTEDELLSLKGGTLYAKKTGNAGVFDKYGRVMETADKVPYMESYIIRLPGGGFRDLLYFEWPEGTVFHGSDCFYLLESGPYISGRVVCGADGRETAAVYATGDYGNSYSEEEKRTVKSRNNLLSFSVPGSTEKVRGYIIRGADKIPEFLYTAVFYVHQETALPFMSPAEYLIDWIENAGAVSKRVDLPIQTHNVFDFEYNALFMLVQ
ncbi:MAG: hypothetical protein II790_06735, partial [Schwartzia sp.]|nr:hypothetical protein [Schwartzia sp. (in: firmicutes)]